MVKAADGAASIIKVMAQWNVDLSKHREGLIKVVEVLQDLYPDLLAHESRRDNPGPKPLVHRNPNPWVLDDDGLEWTIEDWEARRRRPGRPANDPLRFIYWNARLFWNENIGRWRPLFDGQDGAANECAAFLVALAQSIDPGFTAANCHAAHDRERRSREGRERRVGTRREQRRKNKPPRARHGV